MSFSLTVMSPEGFSCFTVGETSPYKMPAEGPPSTLARKD